MSKKMTPTQCAYIAGVIDSDGCISISCSPKTPNLYSIAIKVCISKIEILEWLVETTGVGFIREFNMSRKNKEWDRKNLKQLYHWSIFANNIRIVLPQIQKYLVGKKEQGEIMLKWLGEKSPRGKSINPKIKQWRIENWQRIKLLNKRGL